MSETPAREEYERCIVCGNLTCIPISMPIDWRENYEIGMGQVCAECAMKQRKEAEQQALSNAKNLRAVALNRMDSKNKTDDTGNR